MPVVLAGLARIWLLVLPLEVLPGLVRVADMEMVLLELQLMMWLWGY